VRYNPYGKPNAIPTSANNGSAAAAAMSAALNAQQMMAMAAMAAGMMPPHSQAMNMPFPYPMMPMGIPTALNPQQQQRLVGTGIPQS
jgi:hypothetical protein